MVAFEFVVDITTFVVTLKKIMIMGQANHHLYLLENGLDMAIQLSPYPLRQHSNLIPPTM
jgi:hypothetical protein